MGRAGIVVLNLPVDGVRSFAMRRPPFGTEVEVYFFPDEVDIVRLLNSYTKGFSLSEGAVESIDHYVLDSFGDDSPDVSNRDKVANWLEELGVGAPEKEKICNALFSWNLLVVTLHPEFDAIVPRYQGDVILTDPYERDIRVDCSGEGGDDTFLDMFDPMRDALKKTSNLHASEVENPGL